MHGCESGWKNQSQTGAHYQSPLFESVYPFCIRANGRIHLDDQNHKGDGNVNVTGKIGQIVYTFYSVGAAIG